MEPIPPHDVTVKESGVHITYCMKLVHLHTRKVGVREVKKFLSFPLILCVCGCVGRKCAVIFCVCVVGQGRGGIHT